MLPPKKTARQCVKDFCVSVPETGGHATGKYAFCAVIGIVNHKLYVSTVLIVCLLRNISVDNAGKKLRGSSSFSPYVIVEVELINIWKKNDQSSIFFNVCSFLFVFHKIQEFAGSREQLKIFISTDLSDNELDFVTADSVTEHFYEVY